MTICKCTPSIYVLHAFLTEHDVLVRYPNSLEVHCNEWKTFFQHHDVINCVTVYHQYRAMSHKA